MIVRIVKMEFQPERVDDFLKIFEESCELIRNFPGCTHLELYRGSEHQNILFTYSYWESDTHLQEYRNSELFAKTWVRTKVLFNAKPQAWSLNRTYPI